MTRSVAVAISAFRSDAAVISLLDAIFNAPHSEVSTVIVIDSLGSGLIGETATLRQWPLRYENADTNLGSAGNLARRMEFAAETGADWCLCLNHDASWDVDRLSAMLTIARSRPNVGAVYPVLDHSPREPRWEDGRNHFNPTAGAMSSETPKGGSTAEVLWSSSNSALYALAPLSDGIAIMSELWMGYEDLAYGVALNQGGWIQLSCRSAPLSQVFDYVPRRFLGFERHIPDKPAWYPYYDVRNLILISRRYGSNSVSNRAILCKLLKSSMRIIFFERSKFLRIYLLYLGALAGIFGKSGKGYYP